MMINATQIALSFIHKTLSRSNKNQQTAKILAPVFLWGQFAKTTSLWHGYLSSQDNRNTSVASCQRFSEEKNNWTANLVPDKKAPDETVGAHDGREPRELMTQKQTLKINRATDEYLISDSAYVPVVQHC
jgi:hypothetical protein